MFFHLKNDELGVVVDEGGVGFHANIITITDDWLVHCGKISFQGFRRVADGSVVVLPLAAVKDAHRASCALWWGLDRLNPMMGGVIR